MRSSFMLLFALAACGNAAPPPAANATPSPSTSTATAPTDLPSASPSAAPPSAVASSSAIPTSPEADARRAAEAWLVDVDAGRYAESWTATATLFRAKIDSPTWVKTATSARAPLGALKSRVFRSAKYAKSLPGAPDGEYVVLLFDTVFEKKQQAEEIITPMKDTDGRWHVSGYFIK